jgi:hypothetical protein
MRDLVCAHRVSRWRSTATYRRCRRRTSTARRRCQWPTSSRPCRRLPRSRTHCRRSHAQYVSVCDHLDGRCVRVLQASTAAGRSSLLAAAKCNVELEEQRARAAVRVPSCLITHCLAWCVTRDRHTGVSGSGARSVHTVLYRWRCHC